MLFPDFPSEARCWIYAAAHPLDADTQTALLDHLNAFFDTWTSHQRSVTGAAAIRDDRFLLVAATVPDGTISGCGIDSLTHAVEDAAEDMGLAWAPALHVWYRDDTGQVQSVSRPAFRSLVQEEVVTATTPVFDPSLTTLSEVRSSFEQPAGDSWHGRLFRIPAPA